MKLFQTFGFAFGPCVVLYSLVSGLAWGADGAGPVSQPKLVGGASSVDRMPARQADAAADPFTVIYRFTPADKSRSPGGPVAIDGKGVVYGASYDLKLRSGFIYSLTPPPAGQTAWTYKIIHDFRADDEIFISSLTIDGDALYGTEWHWFDQLAVSSELFRLVRSGNNWTYQLLHQFNDNSEGTFPTGVTAAGNGTFYGTTLSGGVNGYGCFYKYTTTGGFSVLHNFSKNKPNYFGSPLRVGPDGALYGTAVRGGAYDGGAVARLATNGALTTLYSFPKGDYPSDGPIAVAPDGTIYGTTSEGGPNNVGSAWSLTPVPGKPWSFSVIYAYPQFVHSPVQRGLVRDDANNLYGATQASVYRLTPPKSGTSWKYTPLHSFSPSDGSRLGPVRLGKKSGLLYGTAGEGGSKAGECSKYRGCGTVFTIKEF